MKIGLTGVVELEEMSPKVQHQVGASCLSRHCVWSCFCVVLKVYVRHIEKGLITTSAVWLVRRLVHNSVEVL